MNTRLSAGLGVCLALSAGCAGPRSAVVVRETSLGRLPPGLEAKDLAVSTDFIPDTYVGWFSTDNDTNQVLLSPDLRRVAYAVQRHGRWALVIDGKEGPVYRSVGHVRFSPDGTRVAYAVETDEGNSVAVVDGRLDKSYPGVSHLTFSPDSRRFAYVAARDDTDARLVVVDGVPGPEQPLIFNLQFSADSRHVIYETQQPKISDVFDEWSDSEGRRMCVDHKPAPGEAGNWGLFYFTIPFGWHYGVTDWTYSPDGRRLAYAVRKPDEHHDRRIIVVDDVNSPAYEDFDATRPVFSPDGRHVAFAAALRYRAWRVVCDGRDGPLYDWASIPKFSADSQHLLYAAMRAGRQFVVLDGQAGRPYDVVREAVVSSDGSRVAYAAADGPRQWVVVNGVEGPPHPWVSDPVLSPDGRRVAYVAETDRRFAVVLDGRSLGHWPQVVWNSLTFSPDGSHLAFIVQDGDRVHAVVDGRPHRQYTSIETPLPRLTPDRRWVQEKAFQFTPYGRVVYIAHEGGKARIVVDSGVAGTYDRILAATGTPTDPVSLRVIAVRNGEVFRVTVGTAGPEGGAR